MTKTIVDKILESAVTAKPIKLALRRINGFVPPFSNKTIDEADIAVLIWPGRYLPGGERRWEFMIVKGERLVRLDKYNSAKHRVVGFRVSGRDPYSIAEYIGDELGEDTCTGGDLRLLTVPEATPEQAWARLKELGLAH